MPSSSTFYYLSYFNSTFSTKNYLVTASLLLLLHLLLNSISALLDSTLYPIFYQILLILYQILFLILFTTRSNRCSARLNFLYYFLPDFINPLSILTSYIILYQILLVLYQSLSLIIFSTIFYQSYTSFYYIQLYSTYQLLLAFN